MRRGDSRLGQTRRSFVTRPISTHSTTKMFPLWSKHAPWGQTNLPGVKWSRESFLVSRHLLCESSPRFAEQMAGYEKALTRPFHARQIRLPPRRVLRPQRKHLRGRVGRNRPRDKTATSLTQS